ncbi:MAG: aminomethyl-transferring glycine dehydrogenase subunit GcvPA [Gemmatimonadetes bacterium]|nr:aminomethyl-transferring glycine dehydrogenase subunit GcvPA [Gemmatimonadota bacterium]MYG85236.1 aminomethyl-transferring glycine dehydrogenase subunit GcvPA [Gemmatimonadota bacterium]MYJ88903.1 aminomethyl-transferring glycine dehydrogenase subunit GcvPA [Gemmatimonadota bacterium]
MTYIPNTDADRQAMMAVIGIESVEELLSVIPDDVRLDGPLDLPPALSELELHDTMGEMSARNGSADRMASFVGGGMYDHFVPSAIGHLAGRSEFLTCYTPYQPEVSQGTLQGIYEFQTMICELTGLEVANASMYDGASATAEAAMLARSATGRDRVILAGSVHPHYVETVRTYAHGPGIEVETLPCPNGALDPGQLESALTDDTACVIVQHPNFYGCLESMSELERVVHGAGALLVMAVDPISLGVIESPGAYGADIAVGEGQSMGNQVSYGGPALGFFAARDRFVRRMPGRIAGQTIDQENRRGFVLTLQAREQHIRRDKATSNICTSQQLNALMATIYLSLIGKEGLKQVAELCLHKSHYAAARIADLPGYELAFDRSFFKEFVVRTPAPPDKIVTRLADDGLLAGIDLGRFPSLEIEDGLLIAVTERRTRAQIDRLVEALARFS